MALNHSVLGNLLEQAVTDSVITKGDATVAFNVLITLEERDEFALAEAFNYDSMMVETLRGE
jgi:hypothetical protein